MPASSGHLLADQEIGLAPRQVGERVARDHLELDLLQPRAQPRQMARDQHRHRLAGRQAHHAAHRVAEPRAAAIDGERGLLHRLGVGQQLLAGRCRHEAVGQALEQARADLLLQRLHAARHGGMADAQRLGRRGERALAGERQENPEIVPVGIHVQKCTPVLPICGLTNTDVRPRFILMHIEPRLLVFTKGVRWRIAGAVGIGLLAVGLGIARLGLLGWLIGQVFLGRPISELVPSVLLIALVMVLRGLAEHWRAVVAHGTAAMVQKKLRRILYDQVASLGPGTVGRQRSGGLTLSMIDGVEQLETYFGQFLPQFMIALLSPILIFAVVAFVDLPVATVMLGFALFALLAPALWHKWDVKNSQAPTDGLCLVRRRVPRFDPGPGHAEGVRPGQDARRQARGRGARPVPPHHVGAGHQLAGARHHRRLDRRRRGDRADLRRDARRGRRHVAVGPADHPDAGHRNLPADARAAHACCTRAWSACRRRRASIASSTTSPPSPTRRRPRSTRRWRRPSSSRTCASPIPARGAPCMTASPSVPQPASGWDWSDRRAAASRRSCACCCASTIPTTAASCWVATTCARSPSPRSGR